MRQVCKNCLFTLILTRFLNEPNRCENLNYFVILLMTRASPNDFLSFLTRIGSTRWNWNANDLASRLFPNLKFIKSNLMVKFGLF